MSVLKSLKEAQTREDLAHLLGYKTSGLTHIVYKLPPEQKYKRFTIPKANGNYVFKLAGYHVTGFATGRR